MPGLSHKQNSSKIQGGCAALFSKRLQATGVTTRQDKQNGDFIPRICPAQIPTSEHGRILCFRLYKEIYGKGLLGALLWAWVETENFLDGTELVSVPFVTCCVCLTFLAWLCSLLASKTPASVKEVFLKWWLHALPLKINLLLMGASAH